MTVSFKTIGASLGLFASGVAIVAAVEAPAKASNMCFSEGPVTVCVESVAFTPNGFDTLTVRGPGINEKMNIQCRNYRVADWNSYGNLSQSMADSFAADFCSGRGTTGR